MRSLALIIWYVAALLDSYCLHRPENVQFKIHHQLIEQMIDYRAVRLIQMFPRYRN